MSAGFELVTKLWNAVSGKDDFGLREVDPLAIEEPLHFEHKARLIGGKISVKNMMNEGLTSVKVQSLR